jgi:hypothetical protein
VAERVVHELEIVEIQVEQRDGVALACGAREREVQLLTEETAVRQSGDRVVVGEVRDLLGRHPALGHVAAGGDAGRHRAAVVPDQTRRSGDRPQRTVGPAHLRSQTWTTWPSR